jgi:succinate-acetate transporter protein
MGDLPWYISWSVEESHVVDRLCGRFGVMLSCFNCYYHYCTVNAQAKNDIYTFIH